jgi:hypothetical protein
MLAVFVVVLALAGAPANTPVSCQPSLSGGGVTYWNASAIPMRIELSEQVCLAAQYAGANRQERNAISAAHPKLVMFNVLGVGLLNILHEAEHVGMKSMNECLVEKAAFTKVHLLLQRFAPRLYPLTMASATRYHSQLPASYRGC